jgi:hypothetical protein
MFFDDAGVPLGLWREGSYSILIEEDGCYYEFDLDDMDVPLGYWAQNEDEMWEFFDMDVPLGDWPNMPTTGELPLRYVSLAAGLALILAGLFIKAVKRVRAKAI